MALVYQHRAYDPGAGAFVYWQAPTLDLAGAFWIGPPAFGTLQDVLVLRVFDDGTGGGAVATYSTLQDVIDAITLGSLLEGEAWRIAWTGDAYIPDGEVIGTVVAGDPVWNRLIPWSRIGTTPNLLTTTLGGALGTSAGGRPELTVAAVNGSVVEVDFGIRARTPRRLSVAILYTTPAPPDSGDSTFALQMVDDSNSSVKLWGYLIKNPLWECGYFQTGGGVLDTPIGDDAIIGQFAAGRRVDISIIPLSERIIAQPDFLVRGTSVSGSISTTTSTVLLANGDFTSSQKYKMVARLRSTGVVGSAEILGAFIDAPQ